MSPTYFPEVSYSTYAPILSYMPSAEFAFSAKTQTGFVPNWRGIPDPELPFSQYPVAIVNPEFQEIAVGEPAFLSGEASYTTASNPSVQIVSWEWDFGDGNTGSGSVILHSYAAIGEYIGSLTVTDSLGLKDITTFHVRVANTNAFRTIYGITEGMEFFVTFNDGKNWRVYNLRNNKQVFGMRGRAVAVHPNNRLMAWFGDDLGNIWATSDGLITVGDPAGKLPSGIVDMKVHPYTGNSLYVLCDDGRVYSLPANTFADSIIVNTMQIFAEGGSQVPIVVNGPIAIDACQNKPNLFAVAGRNIIYMTADGGYSWEKLDVLDRNITDIEWSKTSDALLVGTDKSAFMVTAFRPRPWILNPDPESEEPIIPDPSYEDANYFGPIVGNSLSATQAPVLGISSLPHSITGAAVAFDQAPVFGSDVSKIYISEPFGNFSLASSYPTAAIKIHNLMADASTRSKFWYSYNTTVFRIYTLGQQLYPFEPLLNLLSRVSDLDQGPLIDTYDIFALDALKIMVPKRGPNGEPCFEINGVYDCLGTPGCYPMAGFLDPYNPDLPPIYQPNDGMFPNLPWIPIGDNDPFPNFEVPFADGEDACLKYCVASYEFTYPVYTTYTYPGGSYQIPNGTYTSTSELTFVEPGLDVFESGGPNNSGFYYITDSILESQWYFPAAQNMALGISFWARMKAAEHPYTFVGWKREGCPGLYLAGFQVIGYCPDYEGKIRIGVDHEPHYHLVPVPAIDDSDNEYWPPDGDNEPPGELYWPVIRSGSGTGSAVSTAHVQPGNTADGTGSSPCLILDDDKWYYYSAVLVGYTAYLRVTNKDGDWVELVYQFQDRVNDWTPSEFDEGSGYTGKMIQELTEYPNIAFIGKPRRNLYSDQVGSSEFWATYEIADNSVIVNSIPPLLSQTNTIKVASVSLGYNRYDESNKPPVASSINAELFGQLVVFDPSHEICGPEVETPLGVIVSEIIMYLHNGSDAYIVRYNLDTNEWELASMAPAHQVISRSGAMMSFGADIVGYREARTHNALTNPEYTDGKLYLSTDKADNWNLVADYPGPLDGFAWPHVSWAEKATNGNIWVTALADQSEGFFYRILQLDTGGNWQGLTEFINGLLPSDMAVNSMDGLLAIVSSGQQIPGSEDESVPLTFEIFNESDLSFEQVPVQILTDGTSSFMPLNDPALVVWGEGGERLIIAAWEVVTFSGFLPDETAAVVFLIKKIAGLWDDNAIYTYTPGMDIGRPVGLESDGSLIFAAFEANIVLRSTDNGDTWEELTMIEDMDSIRTMNYDPTTDTVYIAGIDSSGLAVVQLWNDASTIPASTPSSDSSANINTFTGGPGTETPRTPGYRSMVINP